MVMMAWCMMPFGGSIRDLTNCGESTGHPEARVECTRGGEGPERQRVQTARDSGSSCVSPARKASASSAGSVASWGAPGAVASWRGEGPGGGVGKCVSRSPNYDQNAVQRGGRRYSEN